MMEKLNICGSRSMFQETLIGSYLHIIIFSRLICFFFQVVQRVCFLPFMATPWRMVKISECWCHSLQPPSKIQCWNIFPNLCNGSGHDQQWGEDGKTFTQLSTSGSFCRWLIQWLYKGWKWNFFVLVSWTLLNDS